MLDDVILRIACVARTSEYVPVNMMVAEVHVWHSMVVIRCGEEKAKVLQSFQLVNETKEERDGCPVVHIM